MKHLKGGIIVVFSLFFFISCKTPKVVSVEKYKIEDTVWVLELMRKKEMKYGEEEDKISIKFNRESGMFSGRSGCNQYFGKFAIQGDKLTIVEDIGSTRMACFQELMSVENTYLNILKSVNRYRIADEKLFLFQNELPVLTFSVVPEIK